MPMILGISGWGKLSIKLSGVGTDVMVLVEGYGSATVIVMTMSSFCPMGRW